MKKIMFLFLGILVLSGCTTYTIKKGQAPYDKGYIVTRRGFVIPEFTIGENNNVPDDVGLAKERFQRRRKAVEYYYEKLGDIDSNFKAYFLGPLSAAGGLATSPIRLPIVAYQDYKYNHNPAYKEKVDKIDDERDRVQNTKIKIIKDYLNKYVQDDLNYEKDLMVAKGKEKPAETKPEEQAQVAEQPEAEEPVKTEEVGKAEEKPVAEVSPAEEKPAEVVEQPEQEEKPAEAQVSQPEQPVEEQSAQVAQPEQKTEEAAKAEEVSGGQPEDKEKKMAEELASQEEKKIEEKPAKVSMWQKMKNVFKHKEKPVKAQEEVVKEEKPEKPKVSLWDKMKNVFKPKEKPAASAERIPGEPPVAIIVAKPAKGYSPLRVHFSASRSRAIKGRIVSYEWDFGDGDTSKKPSVINTFYSGSFEPKQFTVTLTIQDDKGNVGTTTTAIEVLNK